MNICLYLESERQRMIRITKCELSRYRSILSMTLDISQELNSVAI